MSPVAMMLLLRHPSEMDLTAPQLTLVTLSACKYSMSTAKSTKD
tara:strand:+ start:101 stop:232 length:132 start_codon:yes stop_codon:yes gene_type:complete